VPGPARTGCPTVSQISFKRAAVALAGRAREQADLVQQGAQQPEPHAGVHVAAGQADPDGEQRLVGVAVQGSHRLGHRDRGRRPAVQCHLDVDGGGVLQPATVLAVSR